MRNLMLTFLVAAALGACAAPEPDSVTLMLDWVPNTNHTGIFIAQNEGYFEDERLDVEIIQPGEVFAELAVAGGAADFGISFQEQVTLARADEIPIVSIAAVIQHNTSGFASRLKDSPQEWEGLRYGSFGSPFEEPTLRELMRCDGGNFEELEIVDTGFADPLALLDEYQIDLAWIFYGWQGIQADLEDIELEIAMMNEWFDCIPDYYTPVIIASESTLAEKPDVVRRLLKAISRGYRFAIEFPDAAADILLEAAPELDDELVFESQEWLASRYQAEADRWGEQDLEVWEAYSRWMADNEIIAEPIQAEEAFSNAYLP